MTSRNLSLPSGVADQTDLKHEAQRLIHGWRILEDRRDIRLEKHHVDAGLKGLMVFPAHALRKIVLRPHFLAILCLDLWTHTVVALGNLLRAR